MLGSVSLYDKPLYDKLNTAADLDAIVHGPAPLLESDILDYKTVREPPDNRDFEKAAKHISGLANSSGGTLIYGVATKDKDNPEKPTGIEPLSPKTVSYLVRHSGIPIRPPVNFKWKTIDVADGQQVLLFDVPQSPLAPHQLVTDCIYYRRQAHQTIPMQHDLVELYFGRRMHPKLQPVEPPDFEMVSEASNLYRSRLSLHNVGGQIAREVFTRIVVPPGMPALNASALISIPGANTQKTSHGTTISHEHTNTLYYPDVPRRCIAVEFRPPDRILGRESLLPSFYLDVYAHESRPYRYKFFVSWEDTMEEGDAPEKLNLLWREIGLPPVIDSA